MDWLTIDELKKQLVIDDDFNDDNEYIEMLGESAEDTVQSLVNDDLSVLASKNGGNLPSAIRHAMRMLVDYFYSTERGSANSEKAIPDAVFTLLKLYRNYEN